MQVISETKLPLCIFWQFEKEGGLGAQWIISLSLTPELILVLVTETHLQDRTNCLSSQHAFLAHISTELAVIIRCCQQRFLLFFTRTKHQLFKPKVRCVCGTLMKGYGPYCRSDISMFFGQKYGPQVKPDE